MHPVCPGVVQAVITLQESWNRAVHEETRLFIALFWCKKVSFLFLYHNTGRACHEKILEVFQRAAKRSIFYYGAGIIRKAGAKNPGNMWGKYTGRGKKTRASEGLFVTVCRFTHCHFADRRAYFHVFRKCREYDCNCSCPGDECSFGNGAGMESWTDKVLSTLSNKSLTTVEASQNISLREGGEHEHDEDENHTNEENHDEEHYDPHVWLNPLNAKKEMENIKDAFVKTDPEHKQYYENNYKAWSDECDRLYNEYQEALNQVKTKNLVVSHEAFGYLCDAFGLNQMGIQGIEPDSEPDPAHMAEIIDFVKANQVKVIFSEELVSPKVAQSIANATGAQLEVLNPIEGLTNTQLENGDDYFTVMRENLTALKKALN